MSATTVCWIQVYPTCYEKRLYRADEWGSCSVCRQPIKDAVERAYGVKGTLRIGRG